MVKKNKHTKNTIELDADYYKAAVARYQNHASQTELFQFSGGAIL